MKIITTVIALLLAVATVNAQENMKENVDFSVWPKGELNSAYAQYFTGNSYLAPLDAKNGGPVNVTFEPRCRNNWHIHHKSVQVLICVAGCGWYVEEGKEPASCARVWSWPSLPRLSTGMGLLKTRGCSISPI